MNIMQLRQAIVELVQYITMHKPTTDHGLRGRIAAHLGIDLARDWKITQSYLDKKTKAEILAFGEQLGIFTDPKAEAFLKDTLGKRKFSALKKAELDRVILESGVDLSGKVPAEILDMGPQRARDVGGEVADCPRDENGICAYMRRKKCATETEDIICCDQCPKLADDECDDDCNDVCPKLAGESVCRVCGCSKEDACEGGCSWVEDDLCSACQGKEAEE